MAALQQHTRLSPPLVGATYMGGNWSKNFINGFRRENVPANFAQLREDGFNAVVLLVSWGDFQPVFDPCCTYDERAFDRLEFLIEQAREAGLDVVLRIGYGWTFQPDAGEVGARIHRLLNDDKVRAAFFAYVSRLGEVERRHANVRLAFLSWEDLILHTIDGDGRKDFRQFIDSLPADDPLRASAASTPELPRRDGPRVALFNAYWDWLLMHKIFEPSAKRIPHLTFEARIDSEPSPHPGTNGKVEYEWIGHESTYRPPGADTIALYWAPFWGAQNQGEQLDAKQSLQLFRALLDKVREHSGSLPMFIDQLNVIDNTLGFERNATLQAAALPEFMDGAFCAMRNTGVFGYAYWTTRDYAESPLYNPSFSYGLDGWHLAAADGAPALHLLRQDSGDFDLRLTPGDVLSQAIASSRGRLPGIEPNLPATVCVTGDTHAPAVLEASVDAAPVRLDFSATGTQRVCSLIATHARDNGVRLALRGVRGSADLRHVELFDHVQLGGLYAPDGKPESLLPELRKLNQRFAGMPGTYDGCDKRRSD
ncbi:MAG: hypothetical protein JSR27_11110 [Proteobacteria bacterium]|nr:hypothetical protein [Pseudomonadota bacterium]